MQLLERGRRGCGALATLQFRKRRGFLQREAQRVPFQQRHGTLGAPPCQRRRRGLAAQAQEAHAGRQGREPFGEEFMQRGLGADLLVIIDHQRCVGRQYLGKRSKQMSGKRRQAELVLSRQQRQLCGAPWRETLRGHAQVIHETRWIGVVGFELQPQAGTVASLQVTRGQRGFASPGRRGEEADWTAISIVEDLVEAFSLENRREQRRGDFRQCWRRDSGSALLASILCIGWPFPPGRGWHGREVP